MPATAGAPVNADGQSESSSWRAHPGASGRPPASTVVMARHHRSVEPQTSQACYGPGQAVNHSEATEATDDGRTCGREREVRQVGRGVAHYGALLVRLTGRA